MTRKDFEAIASALSWERRLSAHTRAQRLYHNKVVWAVAAALKLRAPRFDRNKFFRAAGHEPVEGR